MSNKILISMLEDQLEELDSRIIYAGEFSPHKLEHYKERKAELSKKLEDLYLETYGNENVRNA